MYFSRLPTAPFSCVANYLSVVICVRVCESVRMCEGVMIVICVKV